MIVFYQDSRAVLGNSLFFKTEMHFLESLPAYPFFTSNLLVDFKMGCFVEKAMVNPIAVPVPRSRGRCVSPGIAGSISPDFLSAVGTAVLCPAAFLPGAHPVNAGSVGSRLCFTVGSAGRWARGHFARVTAGQSGLRVPRELGSGCKSAALMGTKTGE